jgi:hypothetical protein
MGDFGVNITKLFLKYLGVHSLGWKVRLVRKAYYLNQLAGLYTHVVVLV